MTAAQTAGYLQRGIPLADRVVLNELYRYAVLSENGKVFFGCSEDCIKVSIANRASKGRLVYHRNQDGEIDGMFMWHRFEPGWTLDDVANWRDDDENGSEILMGETLSDSPAARKWGIWQFLQKEPDALWCKKFAQREIHGELVVREVTNKTLARLLK